MEKINIQLSLSGREIEAFFYSNPEKKPGIIFLHDLTGIQDSTLKTAELLCKEGFQVLVPNLYSKPGGLRYCVQHMFAEYFRNNLPDNNPALNEIMEIIDLFKKNSLVDETKLGIIGQCLTGGFILHAAIRDEIKAPIVFHHSFGLKGSGIPKDCSEKIQNQIQGHFVSIDPFCPSSRVKKLKEELGDRLESHYYNLPHGIPHFFFNTKEGELALLRVIEFMKRKLL